MHSIIQVAYSHNKIYNQTMNKLPTNWKEVKLGDIIDIIMGQSPKSQFYNKDKEGMPFLQGSSTFGHLYPSFEVYSNDIKKIAVNGSVLMSVRAPVGDLNMANTDICIGRGLCSINGKNKSLNRYIFYLLNYYKAKIVNIQTGTVFGAISKDNILNFKVSIPQSEDEQKRIASILSSFDDKIELNNKTNKILEEMAQTIFEEWFINFNFPNANGKPYKKSGGEMINSELGGIPKGWKVGILDDIINIESGKRPNVSSKNMTTEYNIPIYGASSQIGYTNSVLFNEKILITGRVGTHGIVQRINFPCWASDNTFVIRSKFHEYTYQNLKRIDYINLNRGTTQPLIVQSDIKKVKILLNDKIINQYENLTSSLWELWHKNIFENEKLSGIRDSLLPKLMAGEIRAKK